jgi:hypothetical protein
MVNQIMSCESPDLEIDHLLAFAVRNFFSRAGSDMQCACAKNSTSSS